jgi:hypothetical protein
MSAVRESGTFEETLHTLNAAVVAELVRVRTVGDPIRILTNSATN